MSLKTTKYDYFISKRKNKIKLVGLIQPEQF